MYFLNGLIIGMSFIMIAWMCVYVVLRRKFPLSIYLMGILVIVFCFIDAITRFSFWPIGTATVMVCILVTAHFVNNKLEVLEQIKRDREMHERIFDEQAILDELQRKKKI